MNDWRSTVLVLAEGESKEVLPVARGWQTAPPGIGSMLFPLVLVGIVFYFLILRPQQRDRKDRENLPSQLKKNDRVVTIGGIIGQVVSVSADDKEIVLKVDDNTRIRFRRSAIQAVLPDGGNAEDTAKASS